MEQSILKVKKLFWIWFLQKVIGEICQLKFKKISWVQVFIWVEEKLEWQGELVGTNLVLL